MFCSPRNIQNHCHTSPIMDNVHIIKNPKLVIATELAQLQFTYLVLTSIGVYICKQFLGGWGKDNLSHLTHSPIKVILHIYASSYMGNIHVADNCAFSECRRITPPSKKYKNKKNDFHQFCQSMKPFTCILDCSIRC